VTATCVNGAFNLLVKIGSDRLTEIDLGIRVYHPRHQLAESHYVRNQGHELRLTSKVTDERVSHYPTEPLARARTKIIGRTNTH
jgi:hypothetical protein